MTRKRLVKLLMGCGYSRNDAQLLADSARAYPSYAEYWRRQSLKFSFHKATLPAARALRQMANALRAIDWDACAAATRQLINALKGSEESTS